MRRSLSALIVLAASVLGCVTHNVMMMSTRPFRPLPAAVMNSRSRVVAITFHDKHVRPIYETSTDGHTFAFSGAKAMIAGAVASALEGRVAAVRSVDGAPASNFNVHLIPELSVEVSGMLNHNCKVHFALTVANAQGQPVTRREAEADETFVPIVQAPAACDTAFAKAFDTVALQALPEIDRVR